MADYTVSFTRSARKELSRLDRNIIPRIFIKIEALADNPFPVGCRKIQGATDLWRIRIGSYRVIYQIIDHRNCGCPSSPRCLSLLNGRYPHISHSKKFNFFRKVELLPPHVNHPKSTRPHHTCSVPHPALAAECGDTPPPLLSQRPSTSLWRDPLLCAFPMFCAASRPARQ